MKQKSSPTVIFYGLIAAALFLCAAGSVAGSTPSQQQGRRPPKIADDETPPAAPPRGSNRTRSNTKTGRNKNTTTTRLSRNGTGASGVRTPPHGSRTGTANGAPPRTTTRNGPRASSPPTQLQVTFVTGAPGTSIMQNFGDGRHTNLGVTHGDGKLTVQLPRGLHAITASHPTLGKHRQNVEVRAGNNNTFNFKLAGQPAANVNASGSIEDVFRRFLDPKQTDAVTAKDWQSVQQQAAALLLNSPLNMQLRVQSLFAEGQVAYLSGNHGQAVTAFNNAALAMPDSALAFYGLGNAYLATNQLSEAARSYQRVMQINNAFAMAYRGFADVLARQGKNEEAQKYYERARTLGYSSAVANHNAARSLMKQQRWTQALKELSELVKKQPQVELFLDIGDCYVGMKQLHSAARAYQSAIQLSPQSALAHYKYGEVMYESREYAPAFEALEKSLVLDQQGTTINRRRARDLANKSAERLRRM
ncbi:MAG TPA: tetratricopeptide repeat protein [Pyrinomonadaceae bacterium]|jgi:tetratricopeptide (TPR) repeat protein|nr:tetratricopeptide repeat protein [Pyrinomonadaceae bacterium]